MKVWLIEPLSTYEKLKEQKVLSVTAEAAPEHYEIRSQIWIKDRMRRCLPHYSGGPFWWGWSWKPDLRSERHRFMAGSYVCLELEIAEQELLPVDTDGWYCILSESYYCRNEQEAEAWDARWEKYEMQNDAAALETMRVEREASWENALASAPFSAEDADRLFYIAFEPLRLSDVRQVRAFEGAYKLRWYGPHAVGPDDMPALEGYGDPLRIRDRFRTKTISGVTRYEDEEILQLRGYTGQGNDLKVYTLNEKGQPVSFGMQNSRNGWRRELRKVEG